MCARGLHWWWRSVSPQFLRAHDVGFLDRFDLRRGFPISLGLSDYHPLIPVPDPNRSGNHGTGFTGTAGDEVAVRRTVQTRVASKRASLGDTQERDIRIVFEEGSATSTVEPSLGLQGPQIPSLPCLIPPPCDDRSHRLAGLVSGSIRDQPLIASFGVNGGPVL
jgi:hypothetical protein